MQCFSTVVTAVSDEARELIEGGVLILFADGAPPELAEVSVLHRVALEPTAAPPAVGSTLHIAGMSARITAMGDYAWKKIGEIGHVVVNFNGATEAPRPGEIAVEALDCGALAKALQPGAEIAIET